MSTGNKKPAKQQDSDRERSKNPSPSKSSKKQDQSSPSNLVKSICLTDPDGRSSAQKRLDMQIRNAETSDMEIRNAENVTAGAM